METLILLLLYKVWQGSDFQDKDMAKVFERALVIGNVIPLIQRIHQLEEDLDFYKKECGALKAHCSELEVELEYHKKPCDCGYPKTCETCKDNKDIEDLLAKDIDTSLNEIKAQAIKDAMVECAWVIAGDYSAIPLDELKTYANKLREGV
jgi:hypothetical protein